MGKRSKQNFRSKERVVAELSVYERDKKTCNSLQIKAPVGAAVKIGRIRGSVGGQFR